MSNTNYLLNLFNTLERFGTGAARQHNPSFVVKKTFSVFLTSQSIRTLFFSQFVLHLSKQSSSSLPQAFIISTMFSSKNGRNRVK
jgi:hypothetical protein